MNQKTRFKEDAEGTVLEVLALSSKKGDISVRVRSKSKSDKKFVIGMRTVFAAKDEAAALERYAALVVQAEGEGWEVNAVKIGTSKLAFSEMPKPAKAKAKPAAEPAAEKEKPAAKNGKGGK